MKKQKLGLALAAVLLLSGCGGIEKMTETTVTVDDKGTVEELLLEDFSDETYNEEELTAQINELVEAYNKEAGSEAVSVKSIQVKDEQAKVQLEYQFVADYRGFNQVDFFCRIGKRGTERRICFCFRLCGCQRKRCIHCENTGRMRKPAGDHYPGTHAGAGAGNDSVCQQKYGSGQ